MRKWSVRLALVGCIEFIWAKGRMRLDVRLLSAIVIGTSITSSPLPMPVGWLKKDGQN